MNICLARFFNLLIISVFLLGRVLDYSPLQQGLRHTLFVECCLLYNSNDLGVVSSQGGVISQRDKKYIISFGNDLLRLVKSKGGVISLT